MRTIGSHPSSRKCWTRNWAPAATCAWFPPKTSPRIKRELPPNEGGSLAKATLEQLRQNPGADMVVLGSYTPMPGKNEKRIRLDLRVQDTADGETIAEEAITGDQNNLFDLAAQAGARLRQRMGLSPQFSRAMRTKHGSPFPPINGPPGCMSRAGPNCGLLTFWAPGICCCKRWPSTPNFPWPIPLCLKPGGTWATRIRPRRRRSGHGSFLTI